MVGLGSTGRLFALVLPQMTRSAPKVKPPWAHVRAKRRTTFESRLLSMMECCIARDSPHQMGEVNSFLYVTIGLYMIIVNTLPSIAKNLSTAILLQHSSPFSLSYLSMCILAVFGSFLEQLCEN